MVEIEVGETFEETTTISEEDIDQFADVSGDHNPIHTDEEYAENGLFGKRIAHGILVAGSISAAIASMPGEVIYLSQDLQFTDPVYIGDEITASVTVDEEVGNGKYRLNTDVIKEGKKVIVGEAVVLQK